MSRKASAIEGTLPHPIAPRAVVGHGHRSPFAAAAATASARARRLAPDLGALRLGALNTAGPVLADAARRVSLLQPRLLYLPRQRLVPSHARRVFRAQVD